MDAPNKYKVQCTSLERKKEEEELDVRPNVLLALIRTTTVLATVGVCVCVAQSAILIADAILFPLS